jgi:ATP-binding cassette subfamily F protein 3
VKPFDGDMDDYRRFVLDRASSQNASKGSDAERGSQAGQRRDAARSRRETAPLRKKIEEAETRMAKFAGFIERIDAALADPAAFSRDPGNLRNNVPN